ncbi:hypothetical protein FRB99_001259 [Tulasnella sp. 403]|nr:hypothetical protein FRB99_001259 [Tulasnella sp. 403]
MSLWSPDPASLQEVLQVLRELTGSEVAKVQKGYTPRRQVFISIPGYSCYLVHIMAYLTNEDDHVRVVAGLLLRNNAMVIRMGPNNVIGYVKANVLIVLNDHAKEVLDAAHQAVTALNALDQWPEALMQLMQSLDSTDPQQQEAGLHPLKRSFVCRNYPQKLNKDINGQWPLDFIIPKFISLADDPTPRIQFHAITSLSHLISIKPQSLLANINRYIPCLFRHASDENVDIRCCVCSTFTSLLVARYDRLIPDLPMLAQLMLHAMQDKDENVALRACEFWLTFAETPNLALHLVPIIPELVSILLKCMVYREETLLQLNGLGDGASEADKESSIKSWQYGSGQIHDLGGVPSGDSQGVAKQSKYGTTLDNEDDFCGAYNFDLDDPDFSPEWNVRKCAAAALSLLAEHLGNSHLKVLLPHLHERLYSKDWLQKESVILALGALAKGCIGGVELHLPQMVPLLISALNSQKPLIRSTTCWTLGYYALWCTQFETEPEDGRNTYFIPTINGLLRMMSDDNKRVRTAGCQAFIMLLDTDAGPKLVPHVELILQNVMHAFQKCLWRNLTTLYDIIKTLTDAVGNTLENAQFAGILLSPLIKRLGTLDNSDDGLIPLLRAKYQHNPSMGEPNQHLVVTSLDTLGRLTQGLKNSVEVSLATSDPPLLPLVGTCLKVRGNALVYVSPLIDKVQLLSQHPRAPVRESAYALIGEMAISCSGVSRIFIPALIPDIIHQIEPEPEWNFIGASNKAVWSVGEIVLQYGQDPEFLPFVQPLISCLILILLNWRSPLRLNAAVAIGSRISLVYPQLAAPYLDVFAGEWLLAMFVSKENEENDSAFRGFCTLVQANPSGISRHLALFCGLMVNWKTPSDQLRELIRQVLHGFGGRNGPQWDSQILPSLREALRVQYQV